MSSCTFSGSRRIGRAGPEQAVDQRAQPVGLADDDARVFLQFLVRQLAFEQLRGAAQAAERILDLVRELARHHAAAALLREERGIARDAARLGRVDDLDQHAAVRRRRQREIHLVARIGAGDGHELEAAQRNRLAARAAAHDERLELAAVRDQRREPPPARRRRTDGEQVGRGGIEPAHDGARIDGEYRRRELVEKHRGIDGQRRGITRHRAILAANRGGSVVGSGSRSRRGRRRGASGAALAGAPEPASADSASRPGARGT